MKIITILIALLMCASMAVADTVTLDSTESPSSGTSDTLKWEITKINATDRILEVKYIWLDDNQNKIYLNRQGVNTWRCRDIEVPGENSECLDVEDPYECCTGAGTGTCDDMEDTCFADVFGFLIRSQDVGTKIGVGLRTLIWNKMKADILPTPGNDGTFGEE